MAKLDPPFKGRDMNDLSKKIMRGVYPPVGSKYSKDLEYVVSAMLQVRPKDRPTCD